MPARADPVPTTATVSAAEFTSGALCRQAGVTRGMLRLYEREGLVSARRRAASGYLYYGAEAEARLRAIRQLKELGFTLREIGLLLAERGEHGLSARQLKKLAREQLAVIDARIARLQVVREYVQVVASGATQMLDDPECSFLLAFLGAGAGPAITHRKKAAA